MDTTMETEIATRNLNEAYGCTYYLGESYSARPWWNYTYATTTPPEPEYQEAVVGSLMVSQVLN
jgi:hypothetical protein